MNAQNDQDSPTTRGPRPLEIPDFAAKLDLLLASEGKNQEWLRHSLSVTAPNISRWKRENRMPLRHAMVLCRLLDIELNLLLNPDLTAFKRNIEGRLQLGSGKRWQTFAATAAIASKALRLYIEEPEAPSAQQRLRSLDFRRSSVTRSASRKLPSFKIDERLRIVLDPQAIPAVSRSLVAEPSVILIEDPEKLSCLCPSAYASQMTLAKGLGSAQK